LLPADVNIIEWRHNLYDVFRNSTRAVSHEYPAGFLRTCTGAFLRTEIPRISEDFKIESELILYTDYDVMFMPGCDDILNQLSTDSILMTHENNHGAVYNTGVMLSNLAFLKQTYLEFNAYISEKFDFFTGPYDQPMINSFYDGHISDLPQCLNWPTYEGINAEAKIIHFHGVKPKRIEPEWRYILPQMQDLRNKSRGGYEYYCDIWEDIV